MFCDMRCNRWYEIPSGLEQEFGHACRAAATAASEQWKSKDNSGSGDVHSVGLGILFIPDEKLVMNS